MKEKKDYSNSRFKGRIRIDLRHKELIKQFKGQYSQAGFLDMVLNHYWQCKQAQKEMKRRIKPLDEQNPTPQD